MFRKLDLPKHVGGAVFLHSMPGWYEPFEDALCAMKSCSITGVISLAPWHEIQRKGPSYAQALESGGFPIAHQFVPIGASGIPPDPQGFVEAVAKAAARVSAGERLLVHCGVGIGRTGLFAVALLFALGLDRVKALSVVEAAGSRPETREQKQFLEEVDKILAERGL